MHGISLAIYSTSTRISRVAGVASEKDKKANKNIGSTKQISTSYLSICIGSDLPPVAWPQQRLLCMSARVLLYRCWKFTGTGRGVTKTTTTPRGALQQWHLRHHKETTGEWQMIGQEGPQEQQHWQQNVMIVSITCKYCICRGAAATSSTTVAIMTGG